MNSTGLFIKTDRELLKNHLTGYLESQHEGANWHQVILAQRKTRACLVMDNRMSLIESPVITGQHPLAAHL